MMQLESHLPTVVNANSRNRCVFDLTALDRTCMIK